MKIASLTKVSILALSLGLSASSASAKVTCESIIAKIETQLTAKGVTKYTLTAIPKDEKTEAQVVGTCEGGAKKIVYKRG
jgi:hypothetical protein